MPKKKPLISWILAQFQDGTTYKIPAEKITQDDTILRDKEKLLEESKKFSWDQLKNYAFVVDRKDVTDTVKWADVPKSVMYG